MFVFLWLSLAFGNGQSTHLWISEQAIPLLSNPELRELMSDSAFEQQWKNGTMFPDGGYAVGDDYGEIAHWEPFHVEYLNWIATEFSPPWSNEAKKHIAFLMGLASHGLADQSFDAMYFRRAYIYDENGDWDESLDTATDIAFVAQSNPQDVAEHWLPYDGLLSSYTAQGYEVEPSTLDDGQARLRVAVYWVGGMASQSEKVAEYNAQFPWATSHLLDESVPGNPQMEAQIVAAYWEELWKKLQLVSNQPAMDAEALLYTHPLDGSAGHPRSKDDIESSLSFGLSTGIDSTQLNEDHIWVTDASGERHPIGVHVFYGMNSHIVNIEPLEDWALGEYQVHVDKSIPLIGGQALTADVQWKFSTRPIDKVEESSDTAEGHQRGCDSLGQACLQSWLSCFGLLVMYARGRRKSNC